METFFIMKENYIIDDIEISYEELIAILEHTEYVRRIKWSRYILGLCKVNGSKHIIPAEKSKLWKLEMNTPYAELSKSQKKSDIKEVDNIFSEIQKYINEKKLKSKKQLESEIKNIIEK